MFSEGGMRIYRQASPLYSRKGACQGPPLKPRIKRKEKYMSELLFFIIGLILGGSVGITLMCIFQVNRMNGKDDRN